MATLHLMFDLDRKEFVGGSVGGKFLCGLSSVTISKDGVSVLDHEGRNLLADPTKPVGSAPESSKAADDVAQAFGYRSQSADDEEEVTGFGAWERDSPK